MDVEGSSYDCGVMLGQTWGAVLALDAQRVKSGFLPWWRAKPCQKLIAKHAPHLPDIFRGMAKGAGLPEHKVGACLSSGTDSGCTSFALHPRVTLDGTPISGQTKDTPSDRVFRYLVLRLKLKDGPSALTLTYPGQLFGYGFVAGRCAIFRNSLYAGAPPGRLPLEAWGLLALHGRTVADVMELAREPGLACAGHFAVADCQGGIVGVEAGAGGVAFVRPGNGIFTHANHVASGRRLKRHEKWERANLDCSCHRVTRLDELLRSERGRLTTQLAYAALCDHQNYPHSVCSHQSGDLGTTAAVIAEPTRGLLHVSRGAPCCHWPTTYRL